MARSSVQAIAEFLAASKGSGELAAAAVRVFLGITGASGAPYAARLLEALAAAECEVGLCASAAGIEVIATELYGDARLSRDEVLARLTERAGEAVTIHDRARLALAVRERLGAGRRAT